MKVLRYLLGLICLAAGVALFWLALQAHASWYIKTSGIGLGLFLAGFGWAVCWKPALAKEMVIWWPFF